MKQVAFIGLGNMGGPMAKNLLAAGWSVSAFDLSQAALDDVTSEGNTKGVSVLTPQIGETFNLDNDLPKKRWWENISKI